MALGGGGGGAGKAGAIRAGNAFVEIFTKDINVYKSLDRLKGYLNQTGQMMKAGGAAAIAGGAAVVAPIAAMFSTVVSRNETLADLAERFGDTVENVSALSYATGSAGIGLEDLTKSADTLTKKLQGAVEGGGETANMLAEIGLNASDLVDLPISEKIAMIGEAMSKFNLSPDQKLSMVDKLFGERGKQFVNLFNDGNLKELMAEAGSVGAVVTQQDAENAKAISKAIARSWEAIKGIGYSIGGALLPEASVILKASQFVVQATSMVRDFIAENKRMVFGVVLGGLAVMGIGAGLVALGYGFTIVATAIGGLLTAFSAVGAIASAVVGTVTFLFSPLGIAVAAVVAILAGLAYYFSQTETFADMLTAFAEGWNFVKETALSAWSGIRDAISAGDLKLAFRIALQGLTVLWLGLVQQLTRKWVDFKGFFVDTWNDAVMLFKLGWNGAQGAVGDGFLAMLQYLVQQFESSFTTLFEWAAKAARAVGASSIANELDMFADLGKKGQLSGVFAEARNDLAKDTQKTSFDITNQRQTDQEASNAARAAQIAGADADLAAAKADLAASIAEAKVAAEKARIVAAEAPKKAMQQIGPALSELTRGAQGARNFSAIFSAGDKVNEKILQSNLRNGEKIDKQTGEIVGAVGDLIDAMKPLAWGD